MGCETESHWTVMKRSGHLSWVSFAQPPGQSKCTQPSGKEQRRPLRGTTQRRGTGGGRKEWCLWTLLVLEMWKSSLVSSERRALQLTKPASYKTTGGCPGPLASESWLTSKINKYYKRKWDLDQDLFAIFHSITKCGHSINTCRYQLLMLRENRRM